MSCSGWTPPTQEDWMWRSIIWLLQSPDLTPRILQVCKTYGALMSSPLPSALKWTVAALNTCCNYGSPILIWYLAPFGSDMDTGNCMSLDICCVTFSTSFEQDMTEWRAWDRISFHSEYGTCRFRIGDWVVPYRTKWLFNGCCQGCPCLSNSGPHHPKTICTR